MIFESSYWKDELLGTASFLEKKKQQKQWRGSSYAKVEQKIMISFYSIRKLMDAKKLTDVIVQLDVPAVEYAATGKNVTLLNNHKIDELYNLEEPKEKTVKLRFLCNQLVHSYIFMIVTHHVSSQCLASITMSGLTTIMMAG